MYGISQQSQLSESPGMRLMSFLAAHQQEILDREKNNETLVHLYNTGGYWVAFEHSACQLCRLFPRHETAVFNFRDYPFPVVMASVTDADLQAYSRGHILRTAGHDYEILTVPALAPELYKHWYRRTISEFT